MLLSHEHKFCFVHIGKTGGDSIAEALKPYATPDLWKEDEERLVKHLSAIKIAKRFFNPPQKWFSYQSLAVVRPPWEWLHSLYHFKRMMNAVITGPCPDALKELRSDPSWLVRGSSYAQRLESEAMLDFPDFIAMVLRSIVQPGGLRKTFCCTHAGYVMVKQIVKLSDVKEDWPLICKRLGLPDVPELRKINQTYMFDGGPRPHYSTAFSSTLAADVAAAFHDDIAAFGWRFGE